MPATLPVSYTTVSLMMMTLPSLGSITTLTSAHMAHHAGTAEAMINSRLVRKYTLPLTAQYNVLQTAATDIAIYYTLSSRISLMKNDDETPWFKRFKEATKTIDNIVSGKMLLVDSAGTALESRGDIEEAYSNNMNYVPTFWEGTWESMGQDEDKIKDEANKRDDTFLDRLL